MHGSSRSALLSICNKSDKFTKSEWLAETPRSWLFPSMSSSVFNCLQTVFRTEHPLVQRRNTILLRNGGAASGVTRLDEIRKENHSYTLLSQPFAFEYPAKLYCCTSSL
ncbi:unnamed protein product [Durusdinium trenchii]|uniref:Uncharacterized protein n=1 Tax=Durusdinium trenchii TaxID=1381693 RepID=A0ABP0J559_9DINO